MTCKHCDQPIEKNTVRSSPEPNAHYKYKHVFGHLVGCFDNSGNSLRTIAEPVEEK